MPSSRNLTGVLLLFAVAMLLPALALWLRVTPSWRPWCAGWLGGVSVVTFAIYAWDKQRAVKAGGRTPESTLHLLELLGGWPGALLAQQFLRHKNAKRSFQVTFWIIVVIHQYVALDWLLHWQLSGAVWAAAKG
jgi:uncharacterized membrane protein YsdA (DUF1294 family)